MSSLLRIMMSMRVTVTRWSTFCGAFTFDQHAYIPLAISSDTRFEPLTKRLNLQKSLLINRAALGSRIKANTRPSNATSAILFVTLVLSCVADLLSR